MLDSVLGTSSIASKIDVKPFLEYDVFDRHGSTIKLNELFAGEHVGKARHGSLGSSSKILLVFVRHFFCGNCQEYLRSLVESTHMSAENLARHGLKVVIIGCGSPSLINSYRAISGVPSSWQLVADPSTDLYKAFGMQRTLSMGHRQPRYIRRSLTGNMLRSVLQGVKRIPDGDVLAAGGLDINGGEIILEHTKSGWSEVWSHRMTNSRDHTEIDDLLEVLGFVDRTLPTHHTPLPPKHVRAESSPLIRGYEENLAAQIDEDMPLAEKRRPGLRRSISLRRRSWMTKSTELGRSMSFKTPRQAVAA